MLLASLLLVALTSSLCYAAVFTNPAGVANNSYDFIVVGAGTAGCLVAARLTENPSVKVLLIEAGLSDNGTTSGVIHIPGLAGQGVGTIYDWNYTTTSQSGLNNRELSYPRGFVLGGSSALNNAVYSRGPSSDFDKIAAISGDLGWSWLAMLPYIYKNERHVTEWDHLDDTGKYNPLVHGYGSLMTSLTGNITEVETRVFKTTQVDPEFPFNLDLSSGYGLGTGWLQSSIGNSARSDSATAFLNPALGRSNLDLLIQTQVTKLIQTNAKTSQFLGVQFQQQGGPSYKLTAKKEVILSAGSIGTPQILMLSGIGNSTDLTSNGITPLVNLPDVGQNLVDQPIVFAQYAANGTTLSSFLNNPTAVGAALEQYATSQTGIMASNFLLGTLGFYRLPSSSPLLAQYGDPSSGPLSPHYVLSFLGVFLPNPGQTAPTTGNWMSVSINLAAPTSRGSVRLASSDPFNHPIIDPGFLTTDLDISIMTEGVKAAQRFFAASSWKGFVGQPVNNLTSDADIQAFVRGGSGSIKHPLGTAKISKNSDASGVVGPQLLVKKVSGVRVVDGSIMPFASGGFPQAQIYLIAERASDLIKSTWNL